MAIFNSYVSLPEGIVLRLDVWHRSLILPGRQRSVGFGCAGRGPISDEWGENGEDTRVFF